MRDLLAHGPARGFSGLNVTHPCKQDVVAHLDDLSAEAAALEAVNTVVFDDGRAIGHNTDATRLRRELPPRAAATRALDQRRAARRRRRGRGRRARGAAARRRSELAIVDVDSSRAAALRATGSAPSARATLEDLDARRRPHPRHARPAWPRHPGLPLAEALLRPDLWVAEVVYRPLETELLQHARELGCRTLDGGGMAVFQAAGSFELFTGVEPDRERMLRQLRRAGRAGRDVR